MADGLAEFFYDSLDGPRVPKRRRHIERFLKDCTGERGVALLRPAEPVHFPFSDMEAVNVRGERHEVPLCLIGWRGFQECDVECVAISVQISVVERPTICNLCQIVGRSDERGDVPIQGLVPLSDR